MPFVKRTSGKITGHYEHANEQATEFLKVNEPEFIDYLNPPPPTPDEKIERDFQNTDRDRVIFEALFELINRVQALEGKQLITRSQLKTWLENKLP